MKKENDSSTYDEDNLPGQMTFEDFPEIMPERRNDDKVQMLQHTKTNYARRYTGQRND